MLSQEIPTISQCGQDLVVASMLRHVQGSGSWSGIYFIDLGCNDGISGNSTYLIETKYGNGLLIEPNYYLASSILESRKSPLLCCAIAPSPGVYELHTSFSVSTLGTISTGSERTRLHHEANDDLATVLAPGLKLHQIIEYAKSIYSGKQCGFFKVDVEGLEYSVIEQMKSSEFRPLIVEVENNHRSTDVAGLLLDMEYSLAIVMDSFVEIWVKDSIFSQVRHRISQAIEPQLTMIDKAVYSIFMHECR